MNGITQIAVTIEGVSPLLMHNKRLADPADPYTKAMKAISGKRKKTDSDFLELRRLEFEGGMYHDGKQPYIPGDWIEGAVIDGAKEAKKGKTARAGVVCNEDRIPLVYSGPKDVQKLYDKDFVDSRICVVQRNRIVRTRPRFDQWEASFTLSVVDEVLNPADVETALQKAGLLKGLGDFRPKFGRFVVKHFQILK